MVKTRSFIKLELLKVTIFIKMTEIIFVIFQEMFAFYVEISNNFYQSILTIKLVLYLFISILIASFYIFLLGRKNIILAFISSSIIILSVIFISLSIFIGYQKGELDKLGIKILGKIETDKNRNGSIPINLENLDTNFFSKSEIQKVNENFDYFYYNKDTVKLKYNISTSEDYFDLTYIYKFSRFQVSYIYNKRHKKFIVYD